jgi:hypothetical protein
VHSDWLELRKLLHPLMDSLVATTATTNTTNTTNTINTTNTTANTTTTTNTARRLAKNKQHRREQTLWLDTSSLLHHLPPPVTGPVTGPLAAFVLPELRTIAREVLDRQLCSVVRDALWATGRVVGVVGELRVSLRHLETSMKLGNLETWKHSKLP